MLMLANYIKIAFRNLTKSRLYSFLNVFGLALGIAACLLLSLFVGNELSYDRWNPLAGRIVRPVADINFGGNHYQLAVSGSVTGPDAGQELPEVEAWCRFRDNGSYLVKRAGTGQTNIREMEVLTVDSTFFTLFPLKVLAGEPSTCLTRPNTLAMSRSRAEKYLGSPQLAVGQTLVLENRQNWQVTAVYEDMPTVSHFDADLLLAMNGNEEVKNDSPLWATSNNFHTYLLLRAGTDPAVFARKFAQLSERKIAITTQEMLGTTPEAMASTGQYARYNLQNLTEIHLYSDLTVELSPNGNSRYVWVFGAIAAFILLIACINFMNLATARSAGRVREVGVRKALGSSRPALVGQFLTESVLLAGFAMLLGIALAVLALPGYRDLTERDLTMPWGNPLFWVALVGGSGLVGMIAGSYPAFFLSAFQAVRALKGQLHRPGQTATMRSALVVFQFAVSVVLIVSTLLVFQQLNFMQSKRVGFDKSQVIIVEDAYVMGDQIYTFKTEMLRQPAMESGTVSGFLPVPSNRSDQTFSTKRAFEKESAVGMQHWRVDSDYLRTLGVEMARGRNFDSTRPADSSAVVLNETAARLFGFTEPAGQKIYVPGGQLSGPPKPEDFVELTVIGIVKDFHWASLRDNIGPLCFQLGQSQGLAIFRYQGAETANVIAALERQWKQMAPDQPFSYRFLDESFAEMYEAEQRIGKIAALFALLSILISCLGLFGLASFMAEQRTKEIGIRKVLGANVAGITGLLARDFLKLVIVAIVIASPIAYWAMDQWLADFTYRIDIHWWTFVVAGLSAMGIAFLTVSFQSVKAALANPIKSLRNE